jgi:hypothetical protein
LQDRSTVTALPVGSAEAAGAILAFLVAAGSLLVWANVQTVQRGLGAWQPLSIAIAAMGAVAFFGIRLYRSAKARVA